jgi:predicted dehydrogenase
MINVGIIGYGYWGPILLRNFCSIKEFNVKKVCDRNAGKLEKVKQAYPEIITCKDYSEIINDADINLVVIATQPGSHYTLAREALENDKHVLIEKPFVINYEQAEEIRKLLEKSGKIAMIDHPHIFQPDHSKMKAVLFEEKIGKVLHYHSTRADFGLFPTDVNVAWHSLYHDIYIILDLFENEEPTSVKAFGSSHIVPDFDDTAMVQMEFKSGLTADFHVSLIFPNKERKIIITGDKSIVHWDYTAKDKIRVYNKSAEFEAGTGRVDYDITPECEIIEVPNAESIKTELEYLAKCISENEQPKNGVDSGIKIVKILESVDKALKQPGQKVAI